MGVLHRILAHAGFAQVLLLRFGAFGAIIGKKGGRLMEEWNDVYDENRQKTGKIHLRGTPWQPGEYGFVVCVWVYDGEGRILLTRRAPEKCFAGTWENSGGAVKAGEKSRSAVSRELFEETGIRAEPEEFELIDNGKDVCTHYDFYCLKRKTPLSEIQLLPGETDDVMWADFQRVHEMIESKQICEIIGQQFLKHEPLLRMRNMSKL